jgi:hypothetical protein
LRREPLAAVLYWKVSRVRTCPGESRGRFQSFPEWHIPGNRYSIGTKHMIRLMCSNDRQEVERLKRKLFRAGIGSEIRGNPVASVLGIARLEIFIDARDLLRASKVAMPLRPW